MRNRLVFDIIQSLKGMHMNIEWNAEARGGADIMTNAEREQNREEARKALEEMNALIRGRDFAKQVMDERFEELRCKVVSLGWLALCKELHMKEIGGKREMRVRLKLVDPDSAEARAYDL